MKPRLMNQCMVRVVSTKMPSSPAALARCSMRFKTRFRRRPGLARRAIRSKPPFRRSWPSGGVECSAGEDHAIVLDDGVVADVALDPPGAAALDQGAVLLERLDKLEDAAHIVSVASRSSSSFSSTTMVPMPSCTYTSPAGSSHLPQRDDVAAFHAVLAGLDAVLQVNAVSVGWLAAGSWRNHCSAMAKGSSVSMGLSSEAASAGRTRMPGTSVTNQLVGLQGGGHRCGHSPWLRLKASPVGETKGRHEYQGTHVQRAG